MFIFILLLYVLRDTAGQKNFRTIGKTHYASTKAFVLVYDVTNEETFHLIEQFNEFIERVCYQNKKKKKSLFCNLLFRLD
jgi:GTPase SAR1 family protein